MAMKQANLSTHNAQVHKNLLPRGIEEEARKSCTLLLQSCVNDYLYALLRPRHSLNLCSYSKCYSPVLYTIAAPQTDEG